MSRNLNYVENERVLASAVTSCVSFSAFVGIPVGTTGTDIIIDIITAGVKKYKSIIMKKKEKKDDKIVLPAKDKLNTIEVLTSKALIDSHISHDEFASVNNVLREYNEMKEEIKNP